MTGENQIDWAQISELPSVTVDEIDLDILGLLQRGLAGSGLRLTPAGSAAVGSGSGVVLQDVEATPLAALSVADGVVEVQALRELAGLGRLAGPAELAVIVRGVPAESELHEIRSLTADHPRTSWLVLAGHGRQGRELLAQTAALVDGMAGVHDVAWVPWPAAAEGELLGLAELPEAAELAALVGAGRHLTVGRRDHSANQGRGGCVVFFTGLSGSGKSTLARAVRDALESQSARPVTLLDGDDMRRMLTAGLGFDDEGRKTNVRRVSWVAALLAGNGAIAITALIAPFGHLREEARSMAEKANADFLEIWVSTSLEECERRDRKGLYALAREGKIPNFTGISSPYEVPANPDLVVDTSQVSIAEATEQVLAVLAGRGHGDLLAAPQDHHTGGTNHGN